MFRADVSNKFNSLFYNQAALSNDISSTFAKQLKFVKVHAHFNINFNMNNNSKTSSQFRPRQLSQQSIQLFGPTRTGHHES